MTYELEEHFMRANALRHVVLLTYRVSAGAGITDAHVSCFVVEIRGTWVLVTAGHVILEMRNWISSGAVLSMFQLVDAAAGAHQPAYPIAMDIEAWAAVDPLGGGFDVAAMVINPLTVMALQAANVLPIETNAIRPAQFIEGHQLVLVGAPAENFKIGRAGGQMRMSLIPIVEALPSEDMPAAGSSILGQIVGDPTEAEFRVKSVQGMSGCPVFMVSTAGPEEEWRYWAVGIQSSWNAQRRVVRVSQLQPLVDQLETHFAQGTLSDGGAA